SGAGTGWAASSRGVFVSSRRRHTRCLSDWSSDVCSSDLQRRKDSEGDRHDPERILEEIHPRRCVVVSCATRMILLWGSYRRWHQIGRASCRERWLRSAGAVGENENGVETQRVQEDVIAGV